MEIGAWNLWCGISQRYPTEQSDPEAAFIFQKFGFGVWCLVFGVWGSEFRALCLMFRVTGFKILEAWEFQGGRGFRNDFGFRGEVPD